MSLQRSEGLAQRQLDGHSQKKVISFLLAIRFAVRPACAKDWKKMMKRRKKRKSFDLEDLGKGFEGQKSRIGEKKRHRMEWKVQKEKKQEEKI